MPRSKSDDNDTSLHGIRGEIEEGADPSRLPTAAWDPNDRHGEHDATMQQASPQVAVHRALEKAEAGVQRSERMTAHRAAQGGGSPPSRFQRATQMKPKQRPKLSQVFGDRIGKTSSGFGPLLWVTGLVAIGAGAYLAMDVIEVSGLTRVREALAGDDLAELTAAVDEAGALARWTDLDGVLVAAEAVVYRFGDAEPPRRERILSQLERLRGDSAVLARALVSDVDVRARLLNELLSATQNQWVVTASVGALHHIGETRVAQQALAKLLKQETAAAASIISSAQYTDPAHAGRLWDTLSSRGAGKAGWWQVATTEFVASTGADIPPVAAAEGHFTRALRFLQNKKRQAAQIHLDRVGQFVAYQPTFIVEFATRMLDAGQPEAARTLLEQAEGELGPYGRVLKGRLLLAEGKSERGLELLETAWKAGEREPTLLRELIDRGSFNDEAALSGALELWPRNTELVLSRGEQLLGDERFEEASEFLRERLLWLVSKASDRQRARFFTMLARAEIEGQNTAGAANYIERALEAERNYKPAKRLSSQVRQ